MAYDVGSLPGLIELGHLNELGVSLIEFDVTDWLTDYPLGTFNITYIRPGETDVYPVDVTGVSEAAPESGNLELDVTRTELGVLTEAILMWTVSDAVTATAGSGSIVVELAEGGTIKKRSDKVQSYTADGHAAAGDPPEPLADYVQKWGAVDATVTESVPGTAPTAAVTQDNTGTHFVFDLPTDLAAGASATTLDTGEPATAEVTQDGTGAHFAFGLPKGNTGDVTPAAEAARDLALSYAGDAEDSASAAAASALQLASGVASPAGTYADLAALNTANPDHSKTYVTLNDGKWCYYDTTTSAFVVGGVYQAASVVGDIASINSLLAETANNLVEHKLDYAEQAEFPVTNLVANGDFNNGITGWASNDPIVENGKLKINTLTGFACSQLMTVKQNDKYYVATDVISDGVAKVSLLFRNGVTNASDMLITSTTITAKRESAILTATINADRLAINRATTTDNITQLDNIVVINLTNTFGVGNEPTKAEIDIILTKFPSSWFEGTANLKTFKELYIEFAQYKLTAESSILDLIMVEENTPWEVA